MHTMRTAKAAAEYYRERDPNTTITEYMLRNMMDEGTLPSITVGHKRVTSIEAIDRLFSEILGEGSNGR